MNEQQTNHGLWIARYLKGIHDTLMGRGEKYNGEDYQDPFLQLRQCARLTFREENPETLDHSFRYMVNHKLTRLANNQADFDDESRIDTIRDAIGYLTLYAEWLETEASKQVPQDVATEVPTESKQLSWKDSLKKVLTNVSQ